MILLFTTDHCTWCPVVKDMIQEENDALGDAFPVHEINIERCPNIAEVFGILVVPTLVSGATMLSGVPSPTDLRSFLIQSITHGPGPGFQTPPPLVSAQGLATTQSSLQRESGRLSHLARAEEQFLDMHGVEDSSQEHEETSSVEKTSHSA